MSEETFVCTACPGWGDHEYCALKTIVKDGKILRTERIQYTGPEANEGYICTKGVAAARQPYNPDRIMGPMKRIGERGEGKWEQISWDQALDEIAEKMLEIRDNYGSEAIGFWNLAASVPPTYGVHNLMNARFINTWGGVNPVYQYGIDDGPVYAAYYMYGSMPGLYFLTSPFNFDSSNVIFVIGANPVENQQRVVNHLVTARKNGCKIIDIGLIYDGTAAFADQFVGVKPGSDPALLLGMARIIVENGWHNPEYLLEKSTAAFLVRKDNGQFYRTADGNRAVWDLATGTVGECVDGVITVGADEPALEGCYIIDGVEVWTAFEAMKAEYAKYTDECVQEITGVEPEVLHQLAYDYSHADGKAYLMGALGLRYMNQGESYRAMYVLATLTGQQGYPGAGVTSALMTTEYPAQLNDEPIKNPFLGDPEKSPVRDVKLIDFYEGVKAGKYKGLIKTSGNPLHNAPNRGLW
ncbi:MAG: molybdopterin-dependent oxidoreductase, partial [Eggerthellaceae bacterium]|nr:molybdopterin-dependent oxidoreductase [Eggerthellaceae bacterium]